jgi:hypothetical protein
MRHNIPVLTLLFLASQISSTHAGAAAPASAPSAVTIDFDGVTDSAFADFKEHGFGVRAKTSGWMGDTNFGDPPPFIEFETPAGVASTQSVIVTHGGRSFTFQSVAIYSSITTIPYKFRGSLNGLTKYVAKGTVPNTFGNFATVTNPDAATVIDRLVISVTNPLTACCSNPEGIDNIVVTPTTASSK